MSKTASFLTALALALVGLMTGPGYCGDDPGAYLTEKDSRKALKETLTLREEQGGIAGISGTAWILEPSGEWRVAKIRTKDGKEELTTVASGTMSQTELEALAKMLAAQNLMGLPEKSGLEPKINPHNVTLKFGKKTASLAGLPTRRSPALAEHIRKSAADKENVDGGVWQRFAHVVQGVEDICTSADKK